MSKKKLEKTTSELADKMGISRVAVWYRCSDGNLPNGVTATKVGRYYTLRMYPEVWEAITPENKDPFS